MPEGRGFLVLTNEVPASSRLAFPGTIQVWSYGLSTGFWSDPASPAVRSQSALHRPTWFSSSGTSKERCTLVQHGHVFTPDPSSENPPKRDSVVKVLLYSLALYRGDVNMVCCQYAEVTESKNHSAHRTRQGGDCIYQGLLWSYIRQRGYPFRASQSSQRDTTVPHAQAPLRNAPSLPIAQAKGFTARFDN